MADHRKAFERTFDRAGEQLGDVLREIEAAVEAFTDLMARPEAERRGLVQAEARFHDVNLCQLLQAKSRELCFSDPARAVDVARLAVEAAGRLEADHYGEALVEDVLALSWAHLGNAHRVASDLRQAEEALLQAEEHHRLSGEDALIGAQILSFKASLRTSQGRFEEAADLLDGAIAVYREARDRHLEGKVLIQKGIVLGHSGRLRESVRLLRRGLSRIDLLEEPRLHVSARHNLIVFLNESGRHEEARKALEETRGLYLEMGEPTHLIRLRWLEGRILRDLGRFDEAETTLREAMDGFIERGVGFDAALVSLDLAMVYARRGDTGEMKRLAAEMVPVFESRDVHQEALAALLLFRQAAEAEEVTLGLVERIAVYLQRARNNPELRFGEDVRP